MNNQPVPDDFPRTATPPSALPGVQVKFVARVIDGRVVVGLTEDELRGRHTYCEDLVQQLVTYSLRKEQENPRWTREFNLERTAKGLADKGRSGEWDITTLEQAWMLARLKLLLGW